MHLSYYPAVLHVATHGYVAEFSDVPLRSSGETPCDASENAQSALQAYAERLRRSGLQLPAPSTSAFKLEGQSSPAKAYILVPLEMPFPAKETVRA
ncbi:MAG TPA: type II toxin-antitoxin system HicB family antitoxin [Acetobacteraceae bacterium]